MVSTLFSVLSFVSCAVQTITNPPQEFIERDFIIVGGGASGTYAAVRLREDFNASVIVIEPQPRLGGHVQTYTIPQTDYTVEYGVQSYIRYGAAINFFQRFNIDIVPFAARRLTGLNVNIANGEILRNYTPPSANATTKAFETWLDIVEEYESILNPGYWKFPPPDAIPSDLLIPFGEFAQKYHVEAAAPRIMAISNVGVGGLEKVLTLDVMQAFGAPITRGILAGDLFSPVGSNSILYQRAYQLLKKDVLLSSSIHEIERGREGVRAVINSKDGKHMVNAKRLLYTAQPSLENLKPFELDEKEEAAFGTWKSTWSFIGILEISCIPENYSINYISSTAAPSNYLNLRDYPFTLRLDSTGPSGSNLFRVLFATNFSISYQEAKITVTENVRNLVKAGTFNSTTDCEINYLAFTDHNGILIWSQSVEQLKNGFVQELYSLQGHRSTWYTGNTWSADYSSNVWAFTDTVLSKIMENKKL